MSTDGGRRLVDGMTIPEAMEMVARALDALIEQELGELEARATVEDVLIQERARLEARRTAILAELWTKLEGARPHCLRRSTSRPVNSSRSFINGIVRASSGNSWMRWMPPSLDTSTCI